MSAPDNRPNPVREAVTRVVGAIAAIVGLVTGLGSAGLLSAAQVDAVTEFGQQATAAVSGPIAVAAGAVIGLVSAGSVLYGSFKATDRATDQTTPLTSPRDVDGATLVRADGLPLGGNPVGNGPRLTG